MQERAPSRGLMMTPPRPTRSSGGRQRGVGRSALSADHPFSAKKYRENRVLRLALRHDRRWRLSFAFSDAYAARHTHSNESCDQSDENFLHLTPPVWKMANLRPINSSPLVLKSHTFLKSRACAPNTRAMGLHGRDCPARLLRGPSTHRRFIAGQYRRFLAGQHRRARGSS